MATVYIICVTAEASVSKALDLVKKKQAHRFIVAVARASSFAECCNSVIDKAANGDEIHIFMLYGYAEQLEKVSIGEKGTKLFWYGSKYPVCSTTNETKNGSGRIDIKNWCENNNVTFASNEYENKPREFKSANKQRENRRLWVQYRLMRAIVSESDIQKAVNAIIHIGKSGFDAPPAELQNEVKLAIAFYNKGEPDMAGGRYSIDDNNPGGISTLRQNILRFSQLQENVLIAGDTGTGKESVAWYLYDFSQRGREQQQFLSLNCASFSKETAESVLFGHVKGAFTGAVSDKKGLLASADGGVVFLDELHTLDLSVQQKLLRFLETGTFYQLGGQKEEFSNVRIIAAMQPKHRQNILDDLYYRLATFLIETVPLGKMAIDDRINVARNMARRLIKRPKAQGMIGDYGLVSTSATVDDAFVTPEEVRCFSDELRSGGVFYKFLCDHNWPGNMRELNSYVKRYLLAGIHPGANGGAVASSLNLQSGEQGGNFWANLPQETDFETLSDLYLLYQVYIKEIPKDDLATCFNTTIKTVKNRLNAAKKRIKDAAKQYGGVDSFAKQYGFPVDTLEGILK